MGAVVPRALPARRGPLRPVRDRAQRGVPRLDAPVDRPRRRAALGGAGGARHGVGRQLRARLPSLVRARPPHAGAEPRAAAAHRADRLPARRAERGGGQARGRDRARRGLARPRPAVPPRGGHAAPGRAPRGRRRPRGFAGGAAAQPVGLPHLPGARPAGEVAWRDPARVPPAAAAARARPHREPGRPRPLGRGARGAQPLGDVAGDAARAARVDPAAGPDAARRRAPSFAGRAAADPLLRPPQAREPERPARGALRGRDAARPGPRHAADPSHAAPVRPRAARGGPHRERCGRGGGGRRRPGARAAGGGRGRPAPRARPTSAPGDVPEPRRNDRRRRG